MTAADGDLLTGEPEAIGDADAVRDLAEAPHGTCKGCGGAVYERTPTGRWKRKCAACDSTGAPSHRAKGRGKAQADIREGVENMHLAFGMLALARDQELGMLIIGPKKLRQMMAEGRDGEDPPGIAEEAAEAWTELAAQNESVHALLSKTLVGGSWAKLANAYFPLVALAFKRNPPKLGRIKRFFLRRRLNGPRGNGQPPNMPPEARPAAPPP